MNYHTLIINPPGYSHSRCFTEVARAVDEALNLLGAYDPKGTAIVFGAHLAKKLPHKSVIFNAEQVFAWDYLQTLRTKEVWDYSVNNINTLAKHGIKARHCPVAYMPSMTTFSLQFPEEDIDVLMYGSTCNRREAVYNKLRNAGVNVKSVFGVYGKERDELIARSKIVLNVHFYPEAVFEIFRCSHLIANKKFFISEYGKDTALESPFYPTAVFAKYEDLVEKCLEYLDDEYISSQRQGIANAAFEIFKKTSMVESLKGLIE